MIYPDSFPVTKYRLWGKLSIHKKRLDKARAIVDDALALGIAWYIGVSGGKDSMALAHLVSIIMPGVEMWCHKDDLDFPGEKEFVEKATKKYGWNMKIVSPSVSLYEAIQKMNIDVCEDIHSRGTELSDKYFYSMIREQEKKFGGCFLGLRKQESRGRLKNYMSRGSLYQRKNTKWTCNPLSNWTGDDVFAYLVINEIPIFDIYFKTKFHDGDPTRIREAWFLPGQSARKGQVVWLKYYYPELYYKLLDIAPEVGNYV